MRLLAAALAGLLLAAPLAAQEEASPHTATAVGVRGVRYRARDADGGVWGPGAQLRLSGGEERYVAELSLDHTRHESAGTRIRTMPLQLSLIGFFLPEQDASPYLLLGYGWYFVDKSSTGRETRSHPHAGVGAQVFIGKRFSLDAGYRILWSAVWKASESWRPWGRHYKNHGSMVVLSANYRL